MLLLSWNLHLLWVLVWLVWLLAIVWLLEIGNYCLMLWTLLFIAIKPNACTYQPNNDYDNDLKYNLLNLSKTYTSWKTNHPNPPSKRSRNWGWNCRTSLAKVSPLCSRTEKRNSLNSSYTYQWTMNKQILRSRIFWTCGKVWVPTLYFLNMKATLEVSLLIQIMRNRQSSDIRSASQF